MAESLQPVWHGLVAGALAACFSRGATHPADLIKARLQCQGALQSAQYSSTYNALSKIATQEGLPGLYRGFSVVLAGVLPATMAYYGSYELAKSAVPPAWGAGGNLLVGTLTQLVAGLAFTPIDLIKERMQVQSIMKPEVQHHANAWSLVSDLVRQRGLAGIFRGYWITNVVWIPWNTIYIAAYEGFKQSLTKGRAEAGNDTPLPTWVIGCCSASSAALAGLCTHPLDVVKTRVQVLPASSAGHSLTAWQITAKLLQQEGWQGLWSGAGARMLQLAPGAALQWMVYERIKLWLNSSCAGKPCA